jgi:hypothetical protein
LADFFSLPGALNMYDNYARAGNLDKRAKEFAILEPKVNKIGRDSNSPEVRQTVESFNQEYFKALSNSILDDKERHLSEAGAYVGRLIRLKRDCENGTGTNAPATPLDFDACLEAIMKK